MAIAIGLIGGLFVLLALALLGACYRNPRWLIVAVCLILALYKYGQNQLANDAENLEVSAGQATVCLANQIQVILRNGRTENITGFRFTLHGYQPSHSESIAYQSHQADRIVHAGQSWSNCWPVEDLRELPNSQQAVMRWEAEITSVDLAE